MKPDKLLRCDIVPLVGEIPVAGMIFFSWQAMLFTRFLIAFCCSVVATNTAYAEHVDVAPISNEVINTIVSQWAAQPSDPTAAVLSQRLHETEQLLTELEDTTSKRSFKSKVMLLRGEIQQFKELRKSARASVLQHHNRWEGSSAKSFKILKDGDQFRVVERRAKDGTEDYLAQVEQRFDKVINLLEKINGVQGGETKEKIKKAIALLQSFRYSSRPNLGHAKDDEKEKVLPEEHQVQGGRLPQTLPGYVPPITEPVPTFHQNPPELDEGDSTPVAPPPAYTRAPRASSNMYAAAGDFIYAAAPSTPFEASNCNYSRDDLAATADVQLTQEIRDLAEKLQYSPVQIFSHVSNTIKFEPYFGSLKGAMGTLVSGAGNATDQASLTIALLRASNIPARYVKGRVQFFNDQRLLDWVGAKTQTAAANILASGNISAWTNGSNVTFSHVWVEACIPYGNYRGASFDQTGHHWIPLDPSFKNKTYQAGIATNVNFDYATYMSSRTFELPNEFYEGQVTDYIRTQLPRFENNTLDDVGYIGKIVPQQFDVLPASLPYEVLRYEAWAGGLSSETAALPAEHRYSIRIEVGQNADKGNLTLSLPAIVLNRVTLAFIQVPGPDSEVTAAATAYFNDLVARLGTNAALSLTRNGGIQCYWEYFAQIRVEGVLQNSGTPSTKPICTHFANGIANAPTAEELLPPHKLKLTVYTGEGTSSQKRINTVTYNNISSFEHHALQAYAFQASDRLLAERAAKLLNSVRAIPVPASGIINTDETLGEFLHLVGLKYMRYITDGTKRIGELNGGSGWSGNHIGLTSSRTDNSYLFDLPFAVKTGGFLIDVPGGQYRGVDLSTGKTVWETFLLAGYIGSAYESYVWQENARMDAVSSVRGIQFARDNNIPVLTITEANISSVIGQLTTNSNTSLNYSPQTVNTITSRVNGGATVTIPRSLIEYDGWTGQTYIATNQPVNGEFRATFAIGPYAGGYTVAPPVNPWFNPFQPIATGWDIPTFYRNPLSTAAPPVLSSAINFGSNQFSTIGGDPVNMVTGNMYHTETDITIKGRGLPIVFERTYNSMVANQSTAQSTPLGFGWTHSLNHYLQFNDDDFDSTSEASDNDGYTSSVTWVDGSGARKFIQVSGGASGVGINATFTAPEGFYFQVNKVANGQYTLREKNGTTYTFANIDGIVGNIARLESIVDRNGNTLSLTYYIGTRLKRVTDDLGRFLEFGYNFGSGSRIDYIVDWTGRRYEYEYDTKGDLIAFRNPLAVAGTIQPVTYTYYNSTDGINLNHVMRNYNLPRGNGMAFEYYMNGKVFRHSKTTGESITFTYNDFRREATTVDERGFVQKYFFDEKGNPTKTIEQGGGERSYTYDTVNPMNRISQIDPTGYVTGHTYDADGNVTTTTNPSGSTVVNSYFNIFNQPGKIKDPNGNYTLYKYDGKGNRTDVIKLKAGIGAAIVPASYTPNPADILAWTITSYDSFGNPTVIKQVRNFATQVGPTVEFDYNDIANNVLGLNATTLTRCGDRDGDGIITRTTECDVQALAYDPLGRQTAGIDESLYPVNFEFDSVDRIVRSTDAVGNLRSFSFDENGNPLGQKLVLSKNGVSTLLDQTISTYDLSDQIVSTIDAGGQVTAYQYDASGNVVKITNPDGYSLDFEYDANNQVITAFDQEGHTARRELDISGRVRSLTDPNGNQSLFEYHGSSSEGRLKRQYDAIGRYTEFTYDNNGNVTWLTVADPLGIVTRTTFTQYDALNRPTRVAGPVYTDSVLGVVRPVTQYQYDNLGNLTTVLAGYTDGTGINSASDVVTLQETSTFDDLSRRLTQADPLGNSWRYQYDRFGNVTRITDPKNQIVDRTYLYGGLLDVQTTARFAGDPSPHLIDYDYNDLGQVIQVTSPEVTYSYQYDPAHQLTAVVDGRGKKALGYRYSPGGLLDTVTDSEGNQADYLYDPVGRLTGIWAANDDLVTFVRDAGGRLTEKWFVNGDNTRYRYNADNSLAQLVNRAGTGVPVSQHDYTYDGFGNRDTQADLIRTVTQNTRYDYDPLGRLTAVRDADNANALIEGYSYDPLSRRRTTTAADGTIRAYLHDAANQLNEIRQTTPTGPVLASFSYDTNGNLTNKSEGGNTLGLTYDALDRLVQADINSVPSETYAYDPQGRRIEKNANGQLTRYRYAGDDIYAEYGADWTQANTLYTYGTGLDDVLIRDAGGQALHYQQDGLGSVVSVTDMAGAVQGTARYDAWGNTTQATGTIPRYGYTGREPDATGLIYYRARYYDPTVGRFTQRDPKGFIDGVNQYAYAINNPINYTDPRGTSAFSISRINSLTQSNSYYSTSIPTGNAAAAFYSQISSSSQSLGRSTVNVGRISALGSSSTLDRIQVGLDIAGLVPGIGELADLVNAGISLSKGDTVGASLSLAAAIPFVGIAATVGKGGFRTIDALRVTKKGLTTPNKYFGNKTYEEAEKALADKFGSPRGGGKYNKSFFNKKTGRTYNLHKDPSHRGGKGHVDIRKRDLPTNYYKDRPFFLKEGG